MNDTVLAGFAAYIGIDWADRKHDVCVQAAGSTKPQHRVLAHTPEAIDAWAYELRERFGGKPIAVCLELTKGPLVSALTSFSSIQNGSRRCARRARRCVRCNSWSKIAASWSRIGCA